MSEEKRIFDNGRYKACFYVTGAFYGDSKRHLSIVAKNDSGSKAEPFTKSDLSKMLSNGGQGVNYLNFIGVDKFWNEFCVTANEEKRIFKIGDECLNLDRGKWFFDNDNPTELTRSEFAEAANQIVSLDQNALDILWDKFSEPVEDTNHD